MKPETEEFIWNCVWFVIGIALFLIGLAGAFRLAGVFYRNFFLA